jgi:hypothetical protein
MPDDIRDPSHGFPTGRKLLDSERQLLATDKSLSRGVVDHRDPEIHRKNIMDRASEALKQPRKVPHPSLAGTVRVLLDKVGK